MSTSVKKLHRLSGVIMASFLLLHLTNHLFALGGPDLHISVMNLFRHVYRFPPIEILLLSCVLFQVISGIWLVFKKGFLRQPFYIVIQVLSGLYLSFFMIYHVRAVLLGRFQWNVDTDFYFAAEVANRYPEKLFFIPYYTLSLVCMFAHIACVHYIKRMEKLNDTSVFIPVEMFRKNSKREAMGICIVGTIITLFIMIALTGAL
jgi:succinate dehydrogenase/fumarate reductase cytochrome b subunit